MIMKKVVFKTLLFALALSPIIANAQNEKSVTTFVKDKDGLYVNKEELNMVAPECYAETSVYVKDKSWRQVSIDTMTPLFSKERVNELRGSAVGLIFYFNTVKEQLAYMSFQRVYRNSKMLEMPLTDEEMCKIEAAFKLVKWEFLSSHVRAGNGYCQIFFRFNFNSLLKEDDKK
jgi:hypothetical protein